MVLPYMRASKAATLDLNGGVVVVTVGPESPKTFLIHQKVLCKSSKFFTEAISKNWKENRKKLVRLEEEDPEIFLIYMHWLYSWTLPAEDAHTETEASEEYIRLCKAYVLGDKLQDGLFQDFMIDAIVSRCKTPYSTNTKYFPNLAAINIIYQNTPATSKARRLLTDIYITHGNGKWLDLAYARESTSTDFLVDLCIGSLDKRHHDPLGMTALCGYHQHESDPKLCYKNVLKP